MSKVRIRKSRLTPNDHVIHLYQSDRPPRPESLARTQKQVQSSTADFLGSRPHSHSSCLFLNLSSWGRAKAPLGHPPISEGCRRTPAHWLTARGVRSLLRTGSALGTPITQLSTPPRGRVRSLAWVPGLCSLESSRVCQLGDGSLLASSFIALSSLPSLYCTLLFASI
jgi:hypothetical protein